MNKQTTQLFILTGIAVAIFVFFVAFVTPGSDNAESISFTTIEQGFYSGYIGQASVPIFKERDLLEFGIENSGIDFSSSTALFVSMGQKNSGGYSIEIESIVRLGNHLYVNVTEKSPGSNCATTQAITQPYHLVVFDSSVTFSGISFTPHSVVVNCDD